ncbi:RIIA lysis inhibitor [Vibrio phage EniLVp02]
MKMQQQGSPALNSGNMRTKRMTIKSSPKAFRILCAQIYSNPALAMIRELIANAWDAHQKNDNQTSPIRVTLPTELDPMLTIADNGCGMSDDTVFNVYATLFESTKDQSNDEIGAMGLGCKTPFAYDDEQVFVIHTVHQGKLALYSAFMDNGYPCITCIAEPHAPEKPLPDGTEITIPIRREDIGMITENVRMVARWFTDPIVLVNGEHREPPAPLISSDGYFRAYNERPEHHKLFNVDMGHIIYPVNKDNLPTGIQALYTKAQTICTNTNIKAVTFIAALGDVDFSSSREELNYTELVNEFLRRAFNQFMGEVIRQYQGIIDRGNFASIRDAWQHMVDVVKVPHTFVKSHLKFNDRSFDVWIQQLTNLGKNRIKGLVLYQSAPSNSSGYRRRSGGVYGNKANDLIHWTTTPVFLIIDCKDPMTTPITALSEMHNRADVAPIWIDEEASKQQDKLVPLTKSEGTLDLLKKLGMEQCKVYTLSQILEFPEVKKKVAERARMTSNNNHGETKPKSVPVPVFELVPGKGDYIHERERKVDSDFLASGKFVYVYLYFDYYVSSNVDPRRIDLDRKVVYNWAQTIMPDCRVMVIRKTSDKFVKDNQNAINLLSVDTLVKHRNTLLSRQIIEGASVWDMTTYHSNDPVTRRVLTQPKLCKWFTDTELPRLSKAYAAFDRESNTPLTVIEQIHEVTKDRTKHYKPVEYVNYSAHIEKQLTNDFGEATAKSILELIRSSGGNVVQSSVANMVNKLYTMKGNQ